MAKALSIIFISLLLTAGSLYYSYHHLKFDTDQDNLISNSKDYQKNYKKFLKEFGDQESIVVIFEATATNSDAVEQALEALNKTLLPRTDLYTSIDYKLDLSYFEQRFLLTLPKADFEKTKETLTQNTSLIREAFGLSTLDSFLDKTTSFLSSPQATTTNTQGLEDATSFFTDVLKNLDKPDYFNKLDLGHMIANFIDLPDVSSLSQKGYLVSGDGKLAFMQIMPKKDFSTMGVIDKPLAFLKEQIALIQKQNPGLHIGLTGRPVLQHDEMKSTGTDSASSGLIAFVGVFILFAIFYRSGKGPVLAAISLFMGISWTLGFITLTLGHLNLLSMVFAIILIGLGLEYGVHFLFRYQTERLKAPNPASSIRSTLSSIGPTLAISALCSMSAFLSALFTDFLGLKELGFVAGAGLFFCLISQITVLPSLLLLTESKNPKPFKPVHIPLFSGIKKYPKISLLLFTLITAAGVPFLLKITFEHNLLNLQDPSLASVQWEKKLVGADGLSTWFLASLTPSIEELKKRTDVVNNIKSVKKTDSILNILPQNNSERIAELQNLSNQLQLPMVSAANTVTAQNVMALLEKLKTALTGIQNRAFNAGYSGAIEAIEQNIAVIDTHLDTLKNDPESFIKNFNEANALFNQKINSLANTFNGALNPTSTSNTSLPPLVVKHYQSQSGQYALYIYPSQDIWDPQNLKTFIEDIRKIDPLVTGAPITVYESAQLMERGFLMIAGLTLVIVCTILWVDLRKLGDCIIAIIPLAIGVLWLFMIMGILGIRLSLANFFALPLLVGSAIDTGIHMVHHFKETGSAEKTFYDLATPIILSLGTMLIGFGPLAFVHHRGLASFGQIMTIGSLTCLVTSLILMPALFSLLQKKSVPKA
ncbi:MMPL family transporter [bacterium]|nr:MMPL family transporter [bacterium]